MKATVLECLGVTVLLAAAAAADQPSVERFLAAPFSSDLTASRNGRTLAWLVNESGRRNVWTAAAPDYRGKRLTAYDTDDGQELSGLRVSGDGTKVVFVRGGGPNSHGELPNPTSSASGVKQEIWVCDARGGAPRSLGEGSSPELSPKDDSVVFSRSGRLWRIPIDGGEAAQIVHARGALHTVRLSPDGSRLAFVSDRGDHSFIGIYDVSSKALTYLSPSVDRDTAPAWAADGRCIAFLREPRAPRAHTFVPRREGHPWSILVADVADGTARTVFTAAAGRGSVFRELDARDQLLWGPSSRIVFPWERDGWLHLYSIGPDGGEPTALTSGEFEVEDAVVSGDGQRVLFSSNKDDIERRRVFRVDVGGGAVAALSDAKALEWKPVALSGQDVAFFRADFRHPGRPMVRLGGAPARDVLPPDAKPKDFAPEALVEPVVTSFQAKDGVTVHGQLFLPGGLKPGEKRPAVAFLHGGSRRQMLPGWHYMEYYHNAYAMNQYLASRGFVVLAVNYRTGIGYGLDFREASELGAAGASEYRDVVAAGEYLKTRSEVDPARVGLWGGSYGGYLTAMGLARDSALFKAGVDLHGVHDWNLWMRSVMDSSYDQWSSPEARRLAFESSPMASVKTWRSPVLLVHGDDDRNVEFQETVDLAEALRNQGVPFEQLVFPDDVHDFLLHRRWLAAYSAAEAFLARHLGAR